jgi:hypothetical protein
MGRFDSDPVCQFIAFATFTTDRQSNIHERPPMPIHVNRLGMPFRPTPQGESLTPP